MGLKTMQSGKKRRKIAKIKGKIRLISKDNFFGLPFLKCLPGMIYDIVMQMCCEGRCWL